MSPALLPTVRVTLEDADQAARARRSLAETFRGRLRLVDDESNDAQVRIVSLHALPSVPAGEIVVAIGDADLPTVISIMHRRPWLNHVLSPRALEGALAGVLWRLGTRRRQSEGFLGKGFRGRKASLRDSSHRARRIEAIAEFAQSNGASLTTTDRVRDISEELLTNALYDAPSERRGVIDRTRRVVLPKGQRCAITYGTSSQTFYVRVRDPFGTLTRTRMFDVLARCATRREVGFDTTRGGAGLGLWRVFNSASLIVLQVQPGESTEFLVGVDRRRGGRSGRAIHLFFDEGAR
jgi:hypothetical protein